MTCNATTVTYNGIEIVDVLTDEVSQEIVYDQTNTDPIGIRVNVTVTGYVHLSSNLEFGINGSGDLATTMQAVERRLLMPRRTFVMKIGDQDWLKCEPYATEYCNAQIRGPDCRLWDIENGPRPSLRIIGIVSAATMKIRFSIQFCRSVCRDTSTKAGEYSGLMHLRFWMMDDIDCTNWMTTRTYQGVMRFYGGIPQAASGMEYHPNYFARVFAIPPLQYGFQRRAISLTESPDGLTLQFKVVDQEVWAVAPAPATDWEGTFECSIPYGGVACESECNVTLRGGKMTPKFHLVRLALAILDAKLQLIKMAGKYIPMFHSIRESLESNEVTGVARVKHLLEKSTDKPLPLNTYLANAANWFKPFPKAGDGAISPVAMSDIAPSSHRVYDFEHGFQGSSPDGQTNILYAPNSLVGLFVHALQSPCCPIWLANNVGGYAPSTGNPTAGDTAAPSLASQSDTDVRITKTEIAPAPDDFPYHEDQAEAFYWNSKLTSEYLTSTGLAAFPRAQKDSDDNTLSVVRMHAPLQFREIRFEFARAGSWPSLPKPNEVWTDDNSIKHYLLHWTLAPNAASQAADGQGDIRTVAMVMRYALSRPVAWEDRETYPVGRLPNRSADSGNYQFQQLDWSYYSRLFVDEKEIIGVTQ